MALLMKLPNTDAALVVLCKRPRVGEGKQRLAESIGAEAAYKIANALFDCALEDAVAWTGPIVLSPARQEDVEWAREKAEAVGIEFAQVIPQQQGNLGERINQIDRMLRNLGQFQTVFIGTDAPMLTSDHYVEVIEALDEHDIVLANADDGGLIIMANTHPWPDLENLPWSMESLGEAVVELCEEEDLDIDHTKTGYDIDFKEDLIRFYQEYKSDERRARKALIAEIERVMSAGSLLKS